MLDAARQEGITRVVLASSIQVLGTWWEPGARPASTSVAAPINHYGLTKVWAEQMGQMYARVYDLSVIAARIAFMVRGPEEARRLARRRLFDTYLSRGDVGRFFAAAVEAPAIDFAVLYAVYGTPFARLARKPFTLDTLTRWPCVLFTNNGMKARQQ